MNLTADDYARIAADTTSAVPNPGTDEALARGCKCPVIDNHRGRGWHGIPGTFVCTAGCPLHWPDHMGLMLARCLEEDIAAFGDD